MRITDFLDAAAVVPDLKGRDKRAVLREMAERLASLQPMDAKKLLDILLERERIGSTAIGDGVAIPHGKMPGIQKVFGVFGRSLEGVDFDSLDGGLTYLFFLLVAPQDSAADHLKALARIARLLKDPALRARLMAGKSREEIFKAIEEEDRKI